MATGIYGTVRPADMSPEDVDINVFYAPNRGSQNSRTFKFHKHKDKGLMNHILKL